jgi:hypothetical protein
MHLKVFVKLKKSLKTLSTWQKNSKKKPKKTQKTPQKNKKILKKPTGLGVFEKTRVFPTLLGKASDIAKTNQLFV